MKYFDQTHGVKNFNHFNLNVPNNLLPILSYDTTQSVVCESSSQPVTSSLRSNNRWRSKHVPTTRVTDGSREEVNEGTVTRPFGGVMKDPHR